MKQIKSGHNPVSRSNVIFYWPWIEGQSSIQISILLSALNWKPLRHILQLTVYSVWTNMPPHFGCAAMHILTSTGRANVLNLIKRLMNKCQGDFNRWPFSAYSVMIGKNIQCTLSMMTYWPLQSLMICPRVLFKCNVFYWFCLYPYQKMISWNSNSRFTWYRSYLPYRDAYGFQQHVKWGQIVNMKDTTATQQCNLLDSF